MVIFFLIEKDRSMKKRGKVVQPPFAGIILIRSAGIISAFRPLAGSTPVTKLI
jgi:hypothetical protein